jgi:hypothetical protein
MLWRRRIHVIASYEEEDTCHCYQSQKDALEEEEDVFNDTIEGPRLLLAKQLLACGVSLYDMHVSSSS